jgi:hypothetical protein
VPANCHRETCWRWDLQLTEYGNGHWRATFNITRVTHSIIGGSVWQATP